MLKRALLTCALVLAAAAPARASEGPESAGPPLPQAADERQTDLELSQQAYALAQAGRVSEAEPLIERFMATATFAQLPPHIQKATRLARLQMLVRMDRSKDAYPELKSVTDSDRDAPVDWWLVRTEAALRLGDKGETLTSFTTLARRSPTRLFQLNDDFIFVVLNRSHMTPALRARRTDALSALFDSQWRPKDQFSDLDGLRRDLADGLLDAGQIDKARKIVATISDPETIVSMRVSRRFDLLLPAAPGAADLSRIAERYTEAVRRKARAAPDRLAGVNALAATLYRRGRLDEALALVDDALARAQPASGGKSPFTDMDELIWTYNRQSDILLALGRGDEAVAAMKAGAARPERGADNVSQSLNLAEFYLTLGRPRDALSVAESVGENHVSGFGRMVREGARAEAYFDLQDQANLRAPLAYVKDHAADAPFRLFQYFVSAGDEDAAAGELLKLLKDPVTQAGAVDALQDYLIPASAPERTKTRATRLKALRERPDVRAALEPVGRVLSLPFLQ